MVYEDAEKLYTEVRRDSEALVDQALRILYPGSVPLSSVSTVPAVAPLTVFAHNTTPFPRRDIVRVPLAMGRTSSGNVLQLTSDGKEGYVVLESSAGGGLVLPSQISVKDLGGARALLASLSDAATDSSHGIYIRRCLGAQREQRFLRLGEWDCTADRRWRADHEFI
jgi:hypothetical protein